MFDLLDVMRGRAQMTFTGSYYKRLPEEPENGAQLFDYEPVDPTEWRYRKLFGNLINSDGATCSIKTNDDLGGRTEEYMVLQDDKLYKILSVTKDYRSASAETFRYLKDVPQTEYVYRLIEVDNPWGTK